MWKVGLFVGIEAALLLFAFADWFFCYRKAVRKQLQQHHHSTTM